jgi:hypothetical protein
VDTEAAKRTDQRIAVAVLVVSFDGYRDLWAPFFRCFFEQWRDCPYPVYLGSNTETFQHDKVRPIRVGKDRDYSSNLLEMLNQIPEGWVIIFVEDIFLTSQVDTTRVQDIVAAAQRKDTPHVHLMQRRYHHANVLPAYANPSGLLFELPKGLPYRVSINLCLWKKGVLVDLLRPGESVWAMEKHGTRRSFAVEAPFCALSKYYRGPFDGWIHGVIRGRWTREAATFLRGSSFVGWQHRPIQTIAENMRLRAYIIIRYFAFWIAYRTGGVPGMMKLASYRE